MNISLIIIITILVFVPIQQLPIRRKLLIYLVLVLLALQNIEGFGTGIDGEALRNIASLYNSADGTLKVKNIHASGDIKVDGKIESDGPTIGSVLLAKAPANWSNGASHLNKYPGGTVYMGGATEPNGVVNGIISWNGPPVGGSGDSNKNMMHIHSGYYNPSTTTQSKNVLYQNEDIQVKNITANGDITATGGGTFGNAHIGAWPGNKDFAMFSHNNFKTLSGYSVLQENTGTTVINSKGNIHMRKNNSDNHQATLYTGGINAHALGIRCKPLSQCITETNL